MKRRPTLIAALLALVLSFALVDPFHIASGKYDSNPYSEIATELNKSSTSGVLVIASYNDFYKFPVFDYLRDVLGTRLAYHGEIAVEYGYDEVLAQASLGEDSFLQYLKSKNISHLIVPMATVDSGEIFHRWSTYGTIKLDIGSESFSLISKSGGDFPLALYEIKFGDRIFASESPPSYTLSWTGVRPEFYQLLRIIDEGYNVHYLRKYEERLDTAWIFEGEKPKVSLESPSTPEQTFKVDLHFVAAYGDKAPPQVLRVSSESLTKVLRLKSAEISTVSFNMKHGEAISIENVLGCPQGISFDPEGEDIREFCFGLRDVQVRIID